MDVRFSGITAYQGLEDRVSAKLDALQEADASTVTARLNGAGVALDGADADKFMKDEIGVEMPAELKNKSRDEAMAIIGQDPDKYASLIEKLTEAAGDVWGYIDKVFAYYDAAQENGADAEGNPIQEKQV